MRTPIVKSATPFLLALMSLILISCVPTFNNTPSTITPVNKSPSTLTVQITVTEDQNDLYQVSFVKMHFSSNLITNPNPNTVDFANGSRITCNGTNLNFDGTNYTASVPIDQSGTSNCLYVWNNTFTVFPIPGQTRLNPTMNAQGKFITINYNSNGGAGCQFKVDAKDPGQTVTVTSMQDIGSIRNIDISSLSGPGTLILTRTCTLKATNIGFNEVDGTYTATSTMNITWDASP